MNIQIMGHIFVTMHNWLQNGSERGFSQKKGENWKLLKMKFLFPVIREKEGEYEKSFEKLW